MNDLQEVVGLPDPDTRRYVHPVDLPAARGLYARGWWFARACSLPVVIAIGALVWALGGSLFGAIIAPAGVFVVGLIASRWLTTRGWDYIPRKRQDTERTPWSGWAAAIDALALLLIAVAVLLSLTTHPVAEPVLAYAIGSGVGVVLVQLIELIVAAVRRRASWARLLLIVGVAAAVAIVARFGLRDGWNAWNERLLVPAALGCATIVLVQLGWWASHALRPRPPADERAS